MRNLSRLFPLVVLLTSLAAARPAMGWGCKGHQTVAVLAESQLTPEARAAFVALLTANPPDPGMKRWCGNPLPDDQFSDSATWADDARTPTTAPWHFLDIPLDAAPGGPTAAWCGTSSCVTQALQAQLAILKDKTATDAQRATALRYVIHFVGDLHQPLHCANNGDRGGNCVPVKYFKRTPHDKDNAYTPNLHHIWDTEILERESQGAEPNEYAAQLTATFANEITDWQKGPIDFDAWAWESFNHAKDTAYGALHKKIPVEPNVQPHTCAENNDIGQRMLHLHEAVSNGYQDDAASVVEERLAQAGIRLAMILNAAYASLQTP